MSIQIDYMIHICITCSNLETSIDFYTRALGAKLAGEVVSGSDESFGDAMGSPGARSWRGCFLYWGDPQRTSYIDLIEYSPGEAGGAVARNGNDFGFARLALRVPNLDDAIERAKSRGIDLVGPPTRFSAGGLERKIAFIRDPDGTLLELVERVRPQGSGSA